MESFLRWKLGKAGGPILGGSNLQKPVSSYQTMKLPDVCSSFYSIADEPFPQVSGFLDDTVGQSFLSNEAGTALNLSACMPSESITKQKNEEILAPGKETTNSDRNGSMSGACGQSSDQNTSTKSLQNDKDITSAAADKTDRDCNDFNTCGTVSTTSLEKSDNMSVELKNSTFDVTENLKEQSDTGINATVDLHNIREKNSTFESVQSQEPKEVSDARLNSTVDIDIPIIKAESGNATIDLAHTHDPKEGSDTGANATVDITNLDCTRDQINSYSVNSGPSNTKLAEQPNEKHEGTIDIQPHELDKEKEDRSLNSAGDAKINGPLTKNSEETNLNVNVTVEIVEQTDSVPSQRNDCKIVLSSSATFKPVESTFTKCNTTTELTTPDNPVLKNTTIDMKPSSTEITSHDGSNLVAGDAKTDSNNRETEVETSTTAFVCSVEAPTDSPELNLEEHHKTTARPGFAESECIPNSDTGNISRSSIFCLDDTLDMKTSFLVTSTPIIFGKESRFEILKDTKPTPMRKRLSVINSMDALSTDDLVGTSRHDGTGAAQVVENSRQSQKASASCTSCHSQSEPANENRPPTKPTVKRQLPQPSSKLSYPKSSLPPRPHSSLNSTVAVRPKTVQGPQVPHQPVASTLPGHRKTGQLNKVKNIETVKNAASASTVKTSMVSSVSGYNFMAVSKPSSSGIPQMKPSGLQPPTRKRLGLKTPQTTARCSVETVLPQSSNKPTGLPGMRTRSSLLPSLGQKHLNNDGLPSAKRKRIAPAALPTVESDAVQQDEAPHESDCVNCLQHHEKLEKCLQELIRLRSECKNWGPLHEKLEMCVEEMKRI